MSKRLQYVIEGLFKIRKEKFRQFPALTKDLDIVDDEERVTHQLELDDENVGSREACEEQMNYFRVDANYGRNEARWQQLVDEMLGSSEPQSEAEKEE